ncbi:MAG: hypothetical protein ACLPYS_03460 [Vulcanimicrobiaceae bacterium]|jgi:hypothetical protein
MFGVVRHYKADPKQIEQIVRTIRDRFMHPISKAWNFVSWTLIDAGPGGVVTASVFEDELGAELAAGWVRENQAAVALGHPRVTQGPITFRDVNEHVETGYGFVWRYESKPGADQPIAKRIRDGFVPLMRGMPGYAASGALDAGRGVAEWLLVFADEESANAGRERTLAWTGENIGDQLVRPPDVVFGEIKLRIPAQATVTV